MSKVKSLMEMLPFYKYSPSISSKVVLTKRKSDWIDNKKDIGNKGEDIVKHYLETSYNAVVEIQPDNAGYDFKVFVNENISYVEVKATEKNQNIFYISYNEMKIAKEKGDKYKLYFVSINDNEAKISIIVNPFDTLNLNEIFNLKVQDDLSSIKIASIEINLFDLTKFITAQETINIPYN